ncbi:hypothetical protein [Oleiagrimonas sp. C23AA]|uniref:hypothetical protein n=1 Tax=Oleiagrimonas sp. C23AA TaxID=2719047 RepID=UPI001422CD71|nr:hypothetical protein [Oleiagrimonas sp. C23AA]NII10039.1 hypothetical protein [Oleiagrimonas sp. C23AA]
MSPNDRSRDRGRTEPSLGDIDRIDEPAGAPAPAPPPRVDADARRTRERVAHTDDDVAMPPPGGARARRERAAAAAAPSPERPASRRRSWLPAIIILVVIVVGALAWINQDRLRALFPRTQLNSMLDRADKALKSGDLEGHDGNSARELYEAARALEPDNDRALNGLQKVGHAELDRARQALAKGDRQQAEDALSDARELLGGGQDVDAVAAKLDAIRRSQAQIEDLIVKAQDALAEGQLTGNDGAAALYHQILDADPDNAIARHGLDKIGDVLAGQARQQLKQNDLKAAADTVAQMSQLMPNYGDLPSLRASVVQAQKQADAQVQQHLDAAKQAMSAGHFTGDGDDNALAQYRAALAVDADNAEAKAGIGHVAQALVVQAQAAIEAGSADQAAQLLDQAAKLTPKSADLAAAQSQLAALKKRQASQPAAASSASAVASDDSAPAAPASDLSPTDQAKLDKLLVRAKVAAQAGDIMSPPGACAYDLYRAALAIDGNNAKALSGLQSLTHVSEQLFTKALQSGDLDKAGEDLETIDQLDPGDSATDDLRHQLANAWLDRADKAIDQGQDGQALKALAQARKLYPDSPRLKAMYARLGGA